MEYIKNDKPMDYFFINGRKSEPHECLISNHKYFHFNNLNYFIKDWLIKGEVENKIALGYTEEKNPDNCVFDRNSIKVYDWQHGQFKSCTLSAIKYLSESRTYKQNEITTWNFIEHLHERIHNIIQAEEQKHQDQYNSHYLPQNTQQEIVEKVFNTMDDFDYKRIASVTKEFFTNIQPLTIELFNYLNAKDLKEAKQQFEFFNRKYDLFQKLANNVNKMQKVRQGTYDFLTLNKQEAQEASEELYITQNNFVYNDMQPLPPIDFDAHTFYQYAKRLVVKIEDLCMTLEENNGDELEIKKLHELIDSNNSDTKKRAISNAIKKHKSEIASARRQTYLRKRCLNLYEQKYRFEIKNKISNCQNNISKLQKQHLHKSVKNNAESIYETLKCKEPLNSQSKKTIGIWIKEYEIEKMIQKNLIKKNKKDSFVNNILTTANVLGFLSHIKKEERFPKIERFFRSIQKK